MGAFDHVMLVAWGVEFVYNTATGEKGCHLIPGYLKRSLARIQRWHTSFTGQSCGGLPICLKTHKSVSARRFGLSYFFSAAQMLLVFLSWVRFVSFMCCPNTTQGEFPQATHIHYDVRGFWKDDDQRQCGILD